MEKGQFTWWCVLNILGDQRYIGIVIFLIVFENPSFCSWTHFSVEPDILFTLNHNDKYLN